MVSEGESTDLESCAILDVNHMSSVNAGIGCAESAKSVKHTEVKDQKDPKFNLVTGANMYSQSEEGVNSTELSEQKGSKLCSVDLTETNLINENEQR